MVLMGKTFNYIKKIGATLVILVLMLMMGLIFSSQPIDEVIGIVSGQNRAGEFEGKEISSRQYAHFYNYCRQLSANQAENYRDYLTNQCLTTQLRQAFILPRIGSRMGLDISEESVEQKILENVRWEHDRQQEENEEDRYSLGELYRRTIAGYPIALRRRALLAEMVRTTLEQSVNLPEEFSASLEYSKQVKMTLRSLHYNNPKLRELIKPNINIAEEQVRAAYDKEEKAKEEKKRLPYAKRRKFVLDRLKEQEVNKEIQAMREQLKALKDDFTLEQVADITGIPIQSKQLTLKELANTSLEKARFNLMSAKILPELKTEKAFGPVEEGGFTLYAQFSDLSLPKAFLKKEVSASAESTSEESSSGNSSPEEVSSEESSSAKPPANLLSKSPSSPVAAENSFLTRNFIEFIIEEEARRGDFQIYLSPEQSSN